jgi:hypothetical protein
MTNSTQGKGLEPNSEESSDEYALLTKDHWAEIRRRWAEPREYASDAEVEAFFTRYVR